MEKSNRKFVLFFFLAVYLLATGFSVYCLTLKRDALQFQTRDYNYFIEQAARLVDPGLAKHFTVNIEGYNFLGLQGTEGVKTLYQAIHTEYFRYTYAVLYFLGHSTLLIYIFYCLIFFSPILYYAFLSLRKGGGAWKPAALFAGLYILLPAMINSVTYEIRPRILFIAAWSLLILAITHQRPFREKLVFFIFLFSIREESILLGAILIAFNFIAMRSKPGRWKQTLIFLALDVLTAAAFVGFMAWGGYTRIEHAYDPTAFFAGLSAAGWLSIAAGLAALLALTGWIWRKRPAWLQRWLLLLVYASALALTGLSAYRDTQQWAEALAVTTPLSAWDIFLRVLTGAQNSLALYVAMLLLVLLWDFTQKRARAVLAGGLVALCILFAGFSVYTVQGDLAAWNQAAGPARLVWDFKGSIDPYQTYVLLDYDTLQAFYNVDKIAVYNRLPLWMVYVQDQYYPNNKQFLANLIKDKVDYIVIARGSLDNMNELIAMSGVHPTPWGENAGYVILKVK